MRKRTTVRVPVHDNLLFFGAVIIVLPVISLIGARTYLCYISVFIDIDTSDSHALRTAGAYSRAFSQPCFTPVIMRR